MNAHKFSESPCAENHIISRGALSDAARRVGLQKISVFCCISSFLIGNSLIPVILIEVYFFIRYLFTGIHFFRNIFYIVDRFKPVRDIPDLVRIHIADLKVAEIGIPDSLKILRKRFGIIGRKDVVLTAGDPAESDYNQTLYLLAALEKNGVTRADFDSSLVYYYRRAERFSAIYKRVAERLTDEAQEYGASAGELGQF